MFSVQNLIDIFQFKSTPENSGYGMKEEKGNSQIWCWSGWVVAGIFILLLVFNDGVQKVTVPTPLGGIEVELNNGEIDHKIFLDSLYANEFTQAGLIQWLSDKDIYSVSDSDFALALANECEQPFPSDDLDARLRSEKECAEKSGIKELKQLAFEHKVPFHRVGEILEISIPGTIQEAGRGYACDDSNYLGRTVHIINQRHYMQQVKVAIDSKGRYSCKLPSAPDIQLYRADALAVSDPFYGPKEEALVLLAE